MTSRYPKHPCVFRTDLVRTKVDPQVHKLWSERFGSKPPFSNLRLLFREYHCSELNPYGSDTCPYSERECAIAFYKCVIQTCGTKLSTGAKDIRSASGYFRSVARSSALYRADNKPLSRDKDAEAKTEKRPSDPRNEDSRDVEGRRVRRPDSGFVSIAGVLRSLDFGPRQGPAEDGEAGAE